MGYGHGFMVHTLADLTLQFWMILEFIVKVYAPLQGEVIITQTHLYRDRFSSWDSQNLEKNQLKRPNFKY
jgi:hypothetical protein